MEENKTAPETVATSEPVDGQAPTESSSQTQEPVTDAPSYETQFSEFIAKKGWKPEEAPQQLLKSYSELEGKLGNWKEVEDKASQFDEVLPEITTLQQKAAAYDDLLRKQQAAPLPEPDQIDLNTAPTDTLAQLWKVGKIGMAQLPPERQYEVQRTAAKQDAEYDRVIEGKSKDLISKYPILKDERITNLVADRIEKGVDPDKAVQEVQELLQATEKKTEERIRADMNKLKEANIDTSSSPVTTKTNRKVSSVFEAYQLAKEGQS